MTDSWFSLLPVVEHTVWVAGVPSKAHLVEVQANQFIKAISETSKWPAQYLERDAAMAWVKMFFAASQESVQLWAYSAWRSHEHQARIRKDWEDGKRKLRPSKPGWSKHESGLAVDILRSHDDPDGGGPLVGPTDKWLEAHAASFGFFRTVPAEAWHWEYRIIT